MNGTATRFVRWLSAGIPGELYYIRDGAINDYALTFVLPVKADINDIYFDWQTVHDSATETKVIAIASSVIYLKCKRKLKYVYFFLFFF